MTKAVMKLIATVLVGLVALSAFAQDLAKPITYTTAAKPLRLVLEDLSKQAGVKIQTTEDMENEPLILRLQGVSLKDVMDKMADVFAADWVDHGTYRQLERSDVKTAAIRAALLQQRTAKIKEGIESLTKLEQDNPPMDQDQAEKLVKDMLNYAQITKNGRSADSNRLRFVLESRMPSMRFALKSLAKLDPAELATIADGGRIVYSTSPNSLQRPLAGVDEGALQELASGMKLMQSAVAKLKPEFKNGQDYGISSNSTIFTAKPAKFIAVADRTFGILQVNFTLSDEKGNPLIQDYESVGEKWDATFNAREKGLELDKKNATEGYELGAVAKELAARIGHSGAELRPLSAAARNTLLSPATIEPLSVATSDLLLKGAERAGINLIALAPDSVDAAAIVSARTGKTSLERFQQSLRGSGASLEIQDGWIVVKPDDPMAAAEGRVSRPLLEEFLKQVYADQFVSIDSAADLRVACPLGSGFDLAANEVGMLLDNNGTSSLYPQSANSLRFYGSLSAQQRDAARNGGLSLTFESLSTEQKQMISSVVYDGYTQLEFAGQPGPGDDYNQLYGQDKTDLLPDGIPMSTVITVADKEGDAGYTTVQTGSGPSYSYPQELEYMSYAIVQMQHPELMPDYGQHVVGFQLGRQRTVDIKIGLGKYAISDRIQEQRTPKGPPQSVDAFMASLSDEQRKKLQAQIDQYIQAMSRRTTDAKPAPTTTSGGAPPSAR
jgi:hypothetical protein